MKVEIDSLIGSRKHYSIIFDKDNITFADVLEKISKEYEELSSKIFDDEGNLSNEVIAILSREEEKSTSFTNTYRSGENIRSRENYLETGVKDGDKITLFPPMSGG
ncbi:hypothetical protein AKJ37_07010 [candidate division MSBL1 archaeon SCGC-AAA259I09]|uniref:MoaD/ThiS family protein n=2 Tax=candidate division MSBL1 TaxID=215777 RepID=A0A133ULT4_9EURY|nr:hypothetical protein AKJ37_07010 [candidate division MSBL1 archaeon SCGC-AAA259I09]KXA99420.1 hypothetical protein AKJ40_03190 [candidate division MSBL1 archaeon SCGC-AAA259M10]